MTRAPWTSLRFKLTGWLLARAAHHAMRGGQLAKLADEEAAAAEAAQDLAKPVDHLGLSVHFGALALREGARGQAWLNLAKLARVPGPAEPNAGSRPPRRRRGWPREAWRGPAYHRPTTH